LEKGRVAAHLRGAYAQNPCPVYGSPDDLVSHLLLNGDALPGDNGLVHGRVTALDHAVHGHALPRSDDEEVVDFHLLHEHLDPLAPGPLLFPCSNPRPLPRPRIPEEANTPT